MHFVDNAVFIYLKLSSIQYLCEKPLTVYNLSFLSYICINVINSQTSFININYNS